MLSRPRQNRTSISSPYDQRQLLAALRPTTCHAATTVKADNSARENPHVIKRLFAITQLPEESQTKRNTGYATENRTYGKKVLPTQHF